LPLLKFQPSYIIWCYPYRCAKWIFFINSPSKHNQLNTETLFCKMSHMYITVYDDMFRSDSTIFRFLRAMYHATYVAWYIMNNIKDIIFENCAFLGHYTASIGNFSYHYSLHNVPEERSSHLLRGGSLKSQILSSFVRFFIDMPEDVLSTRRNMWHTYWDGNFYWNRVGLR